MSAKPVTPRRVMLSAFLLALSLVGGVTRCCAAPPLLLLFPRVQNDGADHRALAAVRAKLREDKRLAVLTFDPEAPSLLRAATDAKHPEWLTASVTTDGERLDIARTVAAAFAAVVTHADKGDRCDVRLLEVAPPARVWSYAAVPVDQAVEALERDAFSPAPPPAPAVTSPLLPAAVPPPAAPGTALPTAPPPAPAVQIPAPVSPPSPAASAPPAIPKSAIDLTAVQPLITQADQAVARGDLVDAYALYRQAINGAPLSDVPRLKLAQAYLLGGLPDKALNEAQRALEVAPDSLALQEFLIKYDTDNNTSKGKTARYQALVIKNPQDATAHLDLGDALWNDGSYADAETQYKRARDLSPAESLARRVAVAHLARLYAAMGRNEDCLAAMKESGELAYPLVLSVAQNVADNLTAAMDDAHGGFDAGKITRQEFYDKIKSIGGSAQSLADFVAKIKPPGAYSRSFLDRVQAANLLAQAASVMLNFIETSDPARRDKAIQLEKDAQAEMLTAHAAEEKLGLWGDDTRVGEDKS